MNKVQVCVDRQTGDKHANLRNMLNTFCGMDFSRTGDRYVHTPEGLVSCEKCKQACWTLIGELQACLGTEETAAI